MTARKIVLTAMATACITAVAPISAVAAPSTGAAADPTSSVDAYLAQLSPGEQDNQTALIGFNGWLMNDANGYANGYVASVDDLSSRSVTLLWNGQSDNTQNAALNRAAADHITVTVKSWPYSHAQIEQAADAVASSSIWTSVPGFVLSDVVGLDPAHPGLTVEGSFVGATPSNATASLAARAASITGMPTLVVGGVTTTPAAGRDNDTSPFNAGDYMISASKGETCSTGFAINYEGATHTTTARHCTATDYVDRAHSSTHVYSGSANRIDPGAGRWLSSRGSVLSDDGAYNKTDYTKDVVGYADLSVGDRVCTDGGNSGVHCSVKVTKLSVLFNDGTGHGNVSTIEGVEQTSGKIAAIQGDSGGPVIVPLSGGTKVDAAGMVQAITGTLHTGSACGPVYDAGSNKCSASVLFTSFRTIVGGLKGASLNHV